MKAILIIWTAALAALVSCTEQKPAGEPSMAVFSIGESVFPGGETKSVLTSADIDTRKTGITLAAYRGGSLYEVRHYASGLSAMALPLEEGAAFRVYALVNMGDMTASFPQQESALEDLSYTIPSYTEGAESLSSRGIPMCGSLSYIAGGGAAAVIPVKRLLAKVHVNINAYIPGAVIGEVKVGHLNRKLKPFGTSRAESASDAQGLLELSDGEQDTENKNTYEASTENPKRASGHFILYVPENRQGTVEGITTSRDKNPDRNPTVSGRSSLLTYLEVSMTVAGEKWEGPVTYRSYLGGNATTDFEILRNQEYAWTVDYQEDGLQENDWKIVTDELTEYRYRYLLVPSTVSIVVGETAGIVPVRYTDAYRNGQLVQARVGEYYYMKDGYWRIDNTSVANYSIFSGYMFFIYGRSPGTTTLRWSVDPSITATIIVSDAPDVTEYRLEIIPATATLAIGSTHTYRAVLVTRILRNGTLLSESRSELSGSDVQWSVLGSGIASINAAGQVTGLAEGTTTVQAVWSQNSSVVGTATLTVSPDSGIDIDTGWDDGGETGL